MKIHLDTDLGGDIDDLCALALLLRWPQAELTAITTTAEDGGRRAGYVRHVLRLEGREEIPVAAGADVSLGHLRSTPGYPREDVYWGEPIAPSPNPLAAALLLLKRSIEAGAVVVAVGPYTNLCLLEQQHPGILRRARLCLMGGYVYPPREGYLQWGVDMDYNVQEDVPSATSVFQRSDPTLVPLAVTVETALRRAHLEPLSRAGALGRLIARQAEAFAEDESYQAEFGGACPNLPRDLINFQHDPLACAIALGWNEGVEVKEIPLRLETKDGWLHWRIEAGGKPTRVVTGVDGDGFNRFWIDTVAVRL